MKELCSWAYGQMDDRCVITKPVCIYLCPSSPEAVLCLCKNVIKILIDPILSCPLKERFVYNVLSHSTHPKVCDGSNRKFGFQWILHCYISMKWEVMCSRGEMHSCIKQYATL